MPDTATPIPDTDRHSLERRRHELLAHITQGLAGGIGDTFFQRLAQHMALALEADCAFVGEHVPGPQPSIRTIAVYEGGRLQANFSYALTGTPCERVMAGKACCYASGVATLFPGDPSLAEMGIEGYVGVALRNAEDRVVGIAVVLHREPVRDPEFSEQVMQIFAGRAAAELERERAHRLLLERERHYHALFDLAGDGIAILDDGRATECNPALLEMFAASREDLVGKRPEEFAPPIQPDGRDSGQAAHEYIEAALGGEPQHFAWQMRRVDGGLADAEVTLTRLDPGQPGRVLGLVRDVTARRRAERELAEREAQLHTLVEALPDAVVLKDAEGRWLLANTAAQELFGLGQLGWRGRTNAEIAQLAPHLAPALGRCAQGDERAWSTGRPDSSEVGVQGDDGAHQLELSKLPLFAGDGSRRGLVMVGRDITAERCAQEALRREKDLVETLLDTIPGNVFIIDADGCFLRWNRRVEQTLGLTTDEVRGICAMDVLAEADRERIAAVIRRAFAEGYVTAEYSCVHKDGSELPLYATATATEFEGRPCLVCVSMDNAERRRAGQALLDSQRELKRRNDFLQLTHDLTARLQQSSDEQQVLQQTVEVLAAFGQLAHVGIYLPEDDGRTLRLAAHTNRSPAIVETSARLPVDGSLSGLAFRTGEVQYSTDIANDPRVERVSAKALAERGLRTLFAVPMISHGRPLGTLTLSHAEVQHPAQLELDALRSVGQTVALAIANARHLASLEHQAFHDALTGLPNRQLLHREFDRLRKAANPVGSRVALMLFDLDRFKEINDTLGHHVGDELLREIGPRVMSALGRNDALLCRLGGDEFALVLPRDDDDGAVITAGHRVVDALRSPFAVGDLSLEIGASLGIALGPDHGKDGHALLRCADVAMYSAKHTPERVVLYEARIDQHSPQRLALMVDLRRAVRADQLLLYFQPRVDLRRRRVIGFEALVRWQHPDRGLVMPGEFIHFAEMGDLIQPLTHAVLDKATAQLAAWHRAGLDVAVSVNLSTRNLMDEALPETIAEIARHHRLRPMYLELEITETSLMADPERALGVLERIARMGVRLSIDDFGTGYSSLAYLKRLPIGALKIDRGFVFDMLSNARDYLIVRSTASLAGNLGLQVVAEGVEDDETLAALVGMGCDCAQGYLLGCPAPADAIVQWCGTSPYPVARFDDGG